MSIHISILTVFEQLYKPFLQTSLIHRAQEKGIVDIHVNSFFSYVGPKKRIDAPTFGPGAGMLIRPAVVESAIEDKERQYGPAFTIFFSPQGKKLDQPMLEGLAEIVQKKSHLLLVPARYEGMDTRVEEYYADLVLSVGDFVLMGGDLPAMILLEGLLRLFPGVVGKEESVEKESFSGPFIDFPVYTQPVDWKGRVVPAIVRSGNHAAINEWRMQQAARTTVLHHFNWLRTQYLVTSEQEKLVKKFIPPHYILLLYNDVVEKEEERKLAIIKSFDIRDIARSSQVYGCKDFFLILSASQKELLEYLIGSRQDSSEHNKEQDTAISSIKFYDSIDEVINKITEQNGEEPLLITLADLGEKNNVKLISFYDQSLVWEPGRPVLFIFETGTESSNQLSERCDFLLPPPCSFSDGGYLSISSLAAITFDRWLGINLK